MNVRNQSIRRVLRPPRARSPRAPYSPDEEAMIRAADAQRGVPASFLVPVWREGVWG